MRIVVISHSCVREINQSVYAELASQPGMELVVVTPGKWKSDLANRTFLFEKNRQIKNLILPKPVFRPGSQIYHFYWSLFLDVFRQYQPELLFLDEEPWSLSALQTFLVAKALSVKLAFYTKENIFRRWPPPLSWIEYLLLHHTEHAVAVSNEAKDVLLRKNCQAPITVIPHAIDPELFCRQVNKRLKRELSLNGMVIGYLGRLDIDKGLVSLIKAMARVRCKAPHLDFGALIVGEGPDRKQLERLASDLGLRSKIHFTGYIPHHQTPQYIKCMDLLVLPSLTRPYWKEQFGRVLIEALACGVPVIGSNSGEIPHIIDKTGGGIVFHEGDVEELVEKLLILMENRDFRERLASTGKKTVLRSYACSIIADQFSTLFREVLK